VFAVGYQFNVDDGDNESLVEERHAHDFAAAVSRLLPDDPAYKAASCVPHQKAMEYSIKSCAGRPEYILVGLTAKREN
jgi:hypothetical protein